MVFALGSLMGASALHYFSTLPQFGWVISIFWTFIICSVLTLLLVKKHSYKKMLLFVLGIMGGVSWASLHAHYRTNWHFPSIYQNKVLMLEGFIEGIPILSEQDLMFDIYVTQFQNKAQSPPVKIRLFWPRPTLTLRHNDKIRCMVKLKAPWHLSNPGSFDAQKQAFIEGVKAKGRVINLSLLRSSHKISLTQVRASINEKLAGILQNKPLLGVIQAMTLGIRHEISPMQWQIFQFTGTSHIVAISGLHVGLVALLFSKLITWLANRSYYLTSIMPAPFFGALGAIMSALIYAALAGFSTPTQRALIMIIVSMVCLIKRQSPVSSLGYAWLGIFSWDPLAVHQMGFWLSFGCVGALLTGLSHTKGRIWRKWVMPQFIIFIALIPMSFLFFQQISLLAPLANAFFIPLVSVVVVPLCLIGLVLLFICAPISTLFLNMAHGFLQLGWVVLEKMAFLPFNVWQKSIPNTFVFFITLLSALLLLLPRGVPGRFCGWFGLIGLFFLKPEALKWGECRFTLLDVGQGLAAIIQTQNHTLLYDAGPEYRIIPAFLLTQNIRQLDKIIISHGDLDHRAGLRSLTPMIKDNIITSEPKRVPFASLPCIAGEQWEWEGVKFIFLNPSTPQKNRNNLSCVLKVVIGKHSILLTGDIEKEAERQLITVYPDLLKSNILVVPHHGSLTSSTVAFINHVSPQYALFPVGKDNKYAFPKVDILNRYESIGAQNLLVSQTGALLFHLKPDNELTPPIHWRDTSRHYWHFAINSGG